VFYENIRDGLNRRFELIFRPPQEQEFLFFAPTAKITPGYFRLGGRALLPEKKAEKGTF
jgi:hypothetical protein